MGLLNSLFGNNELNDKIQELETVNSEMEAKIADLQKLFLIFLLYSYFSPVRNI